MSVSSLVDKVVKGAIATAIAATETVEEVAESVARNAISAALTRPKRSRETSSVELRKSDHPNKRRRMTAMNILLPKELVRRISEFVIQLTHAQYLTKTGGFDLKYPNVYEVKVIGNRGLQNLPPNYRMSRQFRFNRFEVIRNENLRMHMDPDEALQYERHAIFQTLQNTGYYIIQIPIWLLKSVKLLLD